MRLSRRLEREAGRNLELIWLLNRLKPGYRTIANFRKDTWGGAQGGEPEFCPCGAQTQLGGRGVRPRVLNIVGLDKLIAYLAKSAANLSILPLWTALTAAMARLMTLPAQFAAVTPPNPAESSQRWNLAT